MPVESKFFAPEVFVEEISIDYRNPPTHSSERTGELRLIYVNDLDYRKNHIAPDVY